MRPDVIALNRGPDFVLGLAVEALSDEERPRKDLHGRGRGAGVVQVHVDHEAHQPVVLGTVRHKERFGDVDRLRKTELADLRVREKRELAVEAVDAEDEHDRDRHRAVIETAQIEALFQRISDDAIGVGIPQAAHAALGRGRREGLEVAERHAERRFRFR